MKKTRTRFVCQRCGATSPRWLGRCHECDAWNSYEEETVTAASSGATDGSVETTSEPVSLSEVAGRPTARLSTWIGEFDRVLGGGVVPGSGVLIGGEPGIGKSTLLLQATGELARTLGTVLYVSGEESLQQLKMRAERLGVSSPELFLLCETQVEAILRHAERTNPSVLVVDSIQTTTVSALESAPGNVSQIRESAAALLRYAKATDTPLFLVGHVTKEGSLAGPKVLEHMVDTVVYFEGDAHHAYRIVRATKNRFGSTNELGVFEMTDRGLMAVENPSALFLSHRQEGAAGSAVVCAIEGSRPLMLEAQALVAPTRFNHPMRVATGLDRNRVALLIAVLEKRGGMSLQNADVFVNVTGGVYLDDPGVGLGVLMAMASSQQDASIHSGTVFIGEVGLGGEIRAVGRLPQRLAEAGKLGFERAIVAKRQLDKLRTSTELKVVGVSTVGEALAAVF